MHAQRVCSRELVTACDNAYNNGTPSIDKVMYVFSVEVYNELVCLNTVLSSLWMRLVGKGHLDQI